MLFGLGFDLELDPVPFPKKIIPLEDNDEEEDEAEFADVEELDVELMLLRSTSVSETVSEALFEDESKTERSIFDNCFSFVSRSGEKWEK